MEFRLPEISMDPLEFSWLRIRISLEPKSTSSTEIMCTPLSNLLEMPLLLVLSQPSSNMNPPTPSCMDQLSLWRNRKDKLKLTLMDSLPRKFSSLSSSQPEEFKERLISPFRQ